jgi:hypothetical protein
MKDRMDDLYSSMINLCCECTINEAIENIWIGLDSQQRLAKGWRYFVHLNKLAAPMERMGLIEFTGKYRIGSKKEKIWRIKC